MTYGIGTYREDYRRFVMRKLWGGILFSDWIGGEGSCIFLYSVFCSFYFFFPPRFVILLGNGMG
jgi:hypothetical protein